LYGVVPVRMWNFHDVNHRTNNTSEGEQMAVLHLFHFKILLFIIYILAYNLRFSTRLSKKTTAFQTRFDTLHNRFLKKEINANELLLGLSLLIGKKK